VSLRIFLALVLVLSVAGCGFGGEMTAEELEERLSTENPAALGLGKNENVQCREAVEWDFECTLTVTQGLVTTISSEMAMGFMFDGDDIECGTGPLPVAKGLPAPSEICPAFAR
jgi:hypothetical protein